MLKLPAHRSYDDCVVYQDDEYFWKYYIIPSQPRVSIDKNGKPVFMLIKYAFSDQAREDDADLPGGGGYMVFDAELALDDERVAEIVEELQSDTAEQWERLKDLPASTEKHLYLANHVHNTGGADGSSSVFATTMPQDLQFSRSLSTSLTLGEGFEDNDLEVPEDEPTVVIADPTWLEGTVQLNIPTVGGGLVSGATTERTAAAFGTNNAAFSVDLTPDGATFFQKTLLDDEGDAASDLVPLQVQYELTMLAAVAPAEARVQVHTEKVYRALQEMLHEHHNSYDDDLTVEVAMSSFMQAGMVDIQVNPGGVTDAETLEVLMSQATGIAQGIITNLFAVPIEQDEVGDWGDEVMGSTDEYYRLKVSSEVEKVHFDQTFKLAATIEKKISPSGSLKTFLRSGEEAASDWDMSEFVREIDLDDDFFHTLGLSCKAYANWDEDDINFVEVEVKYEVGDTLKTQTFTFDKENLEEQTWSPRLIDGVREYAYRWRVAFSGRDVQPWNEEKAQGGGFSGGFGLGSFGGLGIGSGSGGGGGLFGQMANNPMSGLLGGLGGGSRLMPRRRKNNAGWVKGTSRRLNISVATPGVIDVMISGEAIDFDNIVSAAIVHVAYADPDNHVEPFARDFLLSKRSPTAHWRQVIHAGWDKPFQYAVEYLLKTGRRIVTPVVSSGGVQHALVVNPPDVDFLDVALVPAGPGWSQVVQCVVSLMYEDEASDDYVADAQLQFTENSQFRRWSVLLKRPEHREYRYKVLTTFKNGDSEEGDWIWMRGEDAVDQAIPIIAEGPPRLQVALFNAAVDFKYTPAVKVHLSYNDRRDNDFDASETFVLESAKDDFTWDIPIREGGPRKYSYQITYHTKDGLVVEHPEVTTEENVIVIPLVTQYELKVDVRSALVDFDATPVVEVNLSYSDPANDIASSETFVFDKKDTETWKVPVEKDSPSGFHVTYTYYLPDGETVIVPQGKVTKKSLIVPRYKAPED